MRPPIATATPDKMPAAPKDIMRVVSGEEPMLRAILSPNIRIFNLPEIENANIIPNAIIGKAGITSCQPRLAKLPLMKTKDCCGKNHE